MAAKCLLASIGSIWSAWAVKELELGLWRAYSVVVVEVVGAPQDMTLGKAVQHNACCFLVAGRDLGPALVVWGPVVDVSNLEEPVKEGVRLSDAIVCGELCKACMDDGAVGQQHGVVAACPLRKPW